jgi:hypothetical protein
LKCYEDDALAPRRLLEQELPDEKLSRQQISVATRVSNMFARALSQLEAAVTRRHTAIVVTVDGLPIDDSEMVDIQRAVCRSLRLRLQYWESWYRRYFDLDDFEKARLQRVYLAYHEFVGDS